MKPNKIATIILTFCLSTICIAQSSNTVVEEVIGIVGSEIVLLSDVETAYLQYSPQMPSITRCEIFDELLFQKLLLTQAELDSITVSDSQIDMELENRIRYFVQQFGSKEKLEDFYGKTLDDIRTDFREAIADQLLAETVKSKITANVKVTPTEVKQYYNSLSWEQIPEVPTQYEIGQIVKVPKVGSKELDEAYQKISDIRQRIINGEDFATMAILYSEDKGSASQGGAIGTVGRGETYTEFEAAAFSLKNGEISDIVKTQAGYHIIKMISRKGDYIDVIHILIRPKVSPYELASARSYLDSIYNVMTADTAMKFEDAAKKFSDEGQNSGGILSNPYTGSTYFDAQQLGSMDPSLFFAIDKMEAGSFSKPMPYQNSEGNDAYRIIYLKSRTTPHKATLESDYSLVKSLAENEKSTEAIASYVKEKAAQTYVMIKDNYKDCNILKKWLSNE